MATVTVNLCHDLAVPFQNPKLKATVGGRSPRAPRPAQGTEWVSDNAE